jgi:hypothetical protein
MGAPIRTSGLTRVGSTLIRRSACRFNRIVHIGRRGTALSGAAFEPLCDLGPAIQELLMITAIVRFRLPQGLSPEDVKRAYEHSAPQFRRAPGIVRKYYLHGADQTGGGVYRCTVLAGKVTRGWSGYLCHRLPATSRSWEN